MENSIPVVTYSYSHWCYQNNVHRKDLSRRREYYDIVTSLINNYPPDLILCSGFMLLITDPLLSTYQNSIINVHPAPLSILDEEGNRKYTGDHAVQLMLDAGEIKVASTVHYMNAQPDQGPIICQSDWLDVPKGICASDLQEQMKWRCDGPALANALEILYHRTISS